MARRKNKKKFTVRSIVSQNFFGKRFFLFIFKTNLALISLIFLIYLGLELAISPRPIFENLGEKYVSVVKGAITTLQVNFIGYPGTPSLSGSDSCSNSQARIFLSWDQTSYTSSYSVYRDNEILRTGLTDLNFSDENLQNQRRYTYKVVAIGPNGSKESNTIEKTTQNCSPAEPEPTPEPEEEDQFDPEIISIFLNGKNINDYSGIPTTKKKKIKFSGLANFGGAKITVTPKFRYKMSRTIISNGNGYWSWTNSPYKLKKKSYTIYFTVSDPNDETKSETVSLRFKIGKPPKIKRATALGGNSPNLYLKKVYFRPVGMNVNLESQNFYSGKSFGGNVTFANSLKDSKINRGKVRNALFRLKIKDERGKLISKIEKNADALAIGYLNNKFANPGFAFRENIPKELKPGKYLLETEVLNEEELVSNQMPIEIKEVPILSLGNNFNLTYTKVQDNLSSIFVWLTFILIPLIIIASTEYWLSQRYFPLNEKDLGKRKFIS